VSEPTISERRAAATVLGTELRAALVALAATEALPEEFEAAAALARRLTEILGRTSRPLTTVAGVDDLAGGIRYFSPTTGPGNPMSPPITITPTPDGVVTRTTLDRRFEGPPGFVHGGITGLLLDEVLGQAATSIGHWGMTAYLNITYRRALPIDVELELTARVDRIDGRKTYVTGAIAVAADPGTAFVQAEALFIEPKPSTQSGYFGDLTDADGHAASPRFGA